MPNKITLLGKKYINIDTIDNIAIPDCFVKRNKIGSAHGEAKLYVGSRQKIEEQGFFDKSGMKGFLLKRDLLDYLEDAKFEYEHPEQIYRNKIADYWSENKQEIDGKGDDILYFKFSKPTSGGDGRFYIVSERRDIFYKEFRKIVLPEITYVSILKLEITQTQGEIVYYFRPHLNSVYDSRHHSSIIARKEEEIEDDTEIETKEKAKIKSARKGQGEYRANVIDLMSECLITRVNDERMLIASHIKPWAVCETNKERVDKYNGLLLTPTYDKLFDQGFITFSNNGSISVSPYLSPLNIKKLGLTHDKKYNLEEHEERSSYLKYHRENIFKK